MAHTISANQLTPGAFVNVRGKVDFSRLTRFLSETELAAEIRRRQATKFPNIPNKQFTTITISDPVIVPSQTNGLTLEERYIQESFYTSQKDGKSRYSIENKSSNFPRFYQVKVNADGTLDNRHLIEIPPKAEPAKELDVVLVLRVYKPKNYPNCGIGLDALIAQEPMRYYQPGTAVSHLAQMGYAIDELSDETRKQAHDEAQKATSMPANTDETAAMASQMATPTPAPIPAPVGDAYSTGANPAMNPTNPMNPAQAGVPNQPMYGNPAPATPVAPTAATPDTWTCPACGATNTGKFCNECGAQKPAPVQGNQYVTPNNLAAAKTGIVYDPENNNRSY